MEMSCIDDAEIRVDDIEQAPALWSQDEGMRGEGRR
jgi:hypothetical protein